MTVMPRTHDWTVDDLDALPDDGLRYELVDGVLLVSAAPFPRHQRVLRGDDAVELARPFPVWLSADLLRE